MSPDEEPRPTGSGSTGSERVPQGGSSAARAKGLVEALAAGQSANGGEFSGVGGAAPGGQSAHAPSTEVDDGSDGHHPAHFAAFAASDTGEDASRVLRDAVKRAPLPSLSGLCFEVMGLAWVFGATAGLGVLSLLFDDLSLVSQAIGPLFTVPKIFGDIRVFLIGAPLLVVCIRMAAGLGSIASDGQGQGTGANAWRAWKLGGRDTIASLGIALQVFGMMAAATLVLLAPLVFFASVVGKDTLGLFGVVLSGLALAFMLVYGAALGALQELSMTSLVRHHRGVGSAILHGWRLMRARPRSSQRMAAAEFASRIIVVGLAITVGRVAGWGWGLAQLILFGALVGGLRCHAWALVYPRIGGLTRVAR